MILSKSIVNYSCYMFDNLLLLRELRRFYQSLAIHMTGLSRQVSLTRYHKYCAVVHDDDKIKAKTKIIWSLGEADGKANGRGGKDGGGPLQPAHAT